MHCLSPDEGPIGLTRAEAEVVSLLMGANSVAGIAATRGSSVGTIRSYLKIINRKLGTNGQTEIVATAWRAISLVPEP